jgi:hypothetical protein
MKKIVIICACVVMLGALGFAAWRLYVGQLAKKTDPIIISNRWHSIGAKWDGNKLITDKTNLPITSNTKDANTEAKPKDNQERAPLPQKLNLIFPGGNTIHLTLDSKPISINDILIKKQEIKTNPMDSIFGYTTYGFSSDNILRRINPEGFIYPRIKDYKNARIKFVKDNIITYYDDFDDFLYDVWSSSKKPLVEICEPTENIAVSKGARLLFWNEIPYQTQENKVFEAQMQQDRQTDISINNLEGYHLLKIGGHLYRIKLFIAENIGIVEVKYDYITDSGLVWKSNTSVVVR